MPATFADTNWFWAIVGHGGGTERPGTAYGTFVTAFAPPGNAPASGEWILGSDQDPAEGVARDRRVGSYWAVDGQVGRGRRFGACACTPLRQRLPETPGFRFRNAGTLPVKSEQFPCTPGLNSRQPLPDLTQRLNPRSELPGFPETVPLVRVAHWSGRWRHRHDPRDKVSAGDAGIPSRTPRSKFPVKERIRPRWRRVAARSDPRYLSAPERNGLQRASARRIERVVRRCESPGR